MSHGDQVHDLPKDFIPLATYADLPLRRRPPQDAPVLRRAFHPEVTHTPRGDQIFQNFLYEICHCRGSWTMENFIEQTVRRIRQQVGDAKVICGLSGGVDSSVTAALLHKAIGDRLVCIFVDNGLLRKNERELVEATFRQHFKINLIVNDATEQFLSNLKGVTDPQEKRKIIGREFIEAFDREAKSIEGAKFLAQGTLYPDVIESGHGYAGTAANIKLHHNVGGLPEELGFELVEPLRELFKDEVRRVGETLGLPDNLVWRHPFPGPGLAVRVIGDVTPRAPARPPRRRRDRPRRTGRPRPLPQDRPGFRRPAPDRHGRRHGRLPLLRIRRRDPGRGIPGFHDGGLGADPL
jgi:GMP synthase (glutamine-hydrolysing)